MEVLIEVKNLSFSYGDKHILRDINLCLEKASFISILGGSGVGKTTLFNLIAGILPLQEGSILYRGAKNYVGKFSYMLQKDLLFEHKTVIENIILPLLIAGQDKKSAMLEAAELLQDFDLLKWADSYPIQLSGGMRQRVALLRTYMFKKEVFLLDEAFSAVDAITKKHLHDWYKKMAEKMGLSSILITHDIDEALFLSDKIYLLKNKPGNLVKEYDLAFMKCLSEEEKALQCFRLKNDIISTLQL